MKSEKFIQIIQVLMAILVMHSCITPSRFRSNYANLNNLIYETRNLNTKPFLKSHMKNGEVYIITDTWEIDTVSNIINGTGSRYNYNRKMLLEGPVSFPVYSAAIFETNIRLPNAEAELLNFVSDTTELSSTIKSCRQVDSTLGGVYNTNQNTRYSGHATCYGTDEHGILTFPGGQRSFLGIFTTLSRVGNCWLSTEEESGNIMVRNIGYDSDHVLKDKSLNKSG
jgi:hypothetical protein